MKIAIIGAGNFGIRSAIEIAAERNNICVLDNLVNSQTTELREPKPFIISNTIMDKPQPFIDISDIPNYHKHKLTCDKNRKVRKKKKSKNKKVRKKK